MKSWQLVRLVAGSLILLETIMRKLGAQPGA